MYQPQPNPPGFIAPNPAYQPAVQPANFNNPRNLPQPHQPVPQPNQQPQIYQQQTTPLVQPNPPASTSFYGPAPNLSAQNPGSPTVPQSTT